MTTTVQRLHSLHTGVDARLAGDGYVVYCNVAVTGVSSVTTDRAYDIYELCADGHIHLDSPPARNVRLVDDPHDLTRLRVVHQHLEGKMWSSCNECVNEDARRN